jgi:hypothetical protein
LAFEKERLSGNLTRRLGHVRLTERSQNPRLKEDESTTMTRLIAAILLGALATAATAQEAEMDDPYVWLEDIEGKKALDWVRAQNRLALDRFEADPLYAPFKETAERILQDKERIP